MPTLHVHLDESGDFTFAPRGSEYYAFAAAWTYNPAPLASDLTGLRFRLLKEGLDIPRFHATTDRQATRNEVVEVLQLHADWRWAGMVIEKRKIHPSIREPKKFYPKFASYLLKFVFRGCLQPGTDRIQVFFDTMPIQKRRSAAIKAIQEVCQYECPPFADYGYYHHESASNAWLQVVDYCCWALTRKWQSGDVRTYDVLAGRLETPELNVTQRGTQSYY